MDDIDRRRFLLTTGIASAALSSGTLSACSVAPVFETELPGGFFSKVAAGRLVEARDDLAKTVTLSLVTSEGAQLFKGPVDVTKVIDRLLNVEGLSMIGDTKDFAAGGFYWSPMGPWLCSDMVKGVVPQMEVNTCTNELRHSILNVFVMWPISYVLDQILILENRRMSGQMANDFPPPPIER